MKLNLGTLAAAVLALIYFAWYDRNLPLTPLRLAGLAIAVPALILLIVARLQLGRAFSLRAKASRLVTTGLYSRIRNPIYVFGLLLMVGFILWATQPVFLLLVAVVIPIQIRRVRREEQVLFQEFGQAYLDYKRRTWF